MLMHEFKDESVRQPVGGGSILTYCVNVFDLQMRLQVDEDVSLSDGAQEAFCLVLNVQNRRCPLWHSRG